MQAWIRNANVITPYVPWEEKLDQSERNLRTWVFVVFSLAQKMSALKHVIVLCDIQSNKYIYKVKFTHITLTVGNRGRHIS